MKAAYEEYMRKDTCPLCGGKRLKASSLAVTVGDQNIYDMTNTSIRVFRDRIQSLSLSDFQKQVGALILKEINARVSFLIDVGLD